MRNVVWLLVALLSALPVAAQTSPLGTSVQPATSSADPVLQPGDIVRIAVWQQPAWSGDFEVAADGTVRHPLYRGVRVTGIPLSVAEERMRAFLRRYEETPTFVMQALFQVIVGGEVRDPKLYTLPPEATVTQAVALAGGPTERGQLDRVRLVRGNQETVLDLTNPASGAAAMPIRSGDQIIVPRRRNILQEYVVPAASVLGGVVTLINLLLLLP
jgi:polysaccharide export outer membrane protein